VNQLNERLAQFIARARSTAWQPDLRVARSLAALFNPVFPGGARCCASQRELPTWWGCRASGERALASLQEQGIIRVEYGGRASSTCRPAFQSLPCRDHA
jgi:hypothetical protein